MTRGRYLEASRIQSPAGDLDHVELRGPDDETLGSLDGVLIDPVERRLRGFVVEPTGRPRLRSRRYLLPTDCHARVEEDGRTRRIAIDADGLERCEGFDTSSVPAYSDQGLPALDVPRARSA